MSTLPERLTGVFGQRAPNFGSVPTGAPINVGNGSTLEAASTASIATGLSSVIGAFSGPPTSSSILAAQSAPVNNDSNPGRVAAMTTVPIWRSKDFPLSYVNDSFVFQMGEHTVTLDIANAIMYGSAIGRLARGTAAPPPSAVSWNMFDRDLGHSSSRKVSIDTAGARFMGKNSVRAATVQEADFKIMPLGTIHAIERQRMAHRPSTSPGLMTVHMQGLVKCVDYWELLRKREMMALYFIIKPLAGPYRAAAPMGNSDALTADIAAQLNDPATPQMVPYLGAQIDGVARTSPARSSFIQGPSKEMPSYLNEWRSLSAESSEVKRITHGIFDGFREDGTVIYRAGDEMDADEYLITNYSAAAVKTAGVYHGGLSPLEYGDFEGTAFEPTMSGATAQLPFNGALAGHAPRIRIVRNGHYY